MKTGLKKILHHLPFKRHLFLGFRLFLRLPESVWKHLYFNGIFKVSLPGSASFKMMHYGYQLENELFWKGVNHGWEKYSVGLWNKLVLNSEVIIDVGANTGIYSLLAKALNPSSKVFAFEPVERVFSKLKKNCFLNQYNIQCEQLALSNYNGEAVFYDIPEYEHIYSVTINKNLNDPAISVKETKVETKTLDTYLLENGLDRIDLIKIDVEIHEPEVLEGFKQGLKKYKPTLLIEILTPEVGKRVETLVGSLGYLYFNIDENKGIRQTPSIGKSDYYNYLLCTPEIADVLELVYK